MLRFCFDEPPRSGEGELQHLFDLLDQYRERNNGRGRRKDQALRLRMWAKSLEVTIDELEQSVYCSDQYAGQVKHLYVEQMNEEEKLAYRRHLYFFRNGFIRVFSTLDKLGSFMDEHFALNTGRVKPKYSYYTVLRQLKESRKHDELRRRLYDLKVRYEASMQDLRLMRNHEVHALNVELLDDQGHLRMRPGENREQIEDLDYNGKRLGDGYRMVIRSTEAVFQYILKHS